MAAGRDEAAVEEAAVVVGTDEEEEEGVEVKVDGVGDADVKEAVGAGAELVTVPGTGGGTAVLVYAGGK